MRKTRRKLLTLSLAQLPVKCAHHWVTDESIKHAIIDGIEDDPRIPWNDRTNRAARIGTIACLMLEGVKFPPLALRITGSHYELEDGHHRLRAMQFLGYTDRMQVAVAGNWRKLAHLPAHITVLSPVVAQEVAEA